MRDGVSSSNAQGSNTLVRSTVTGIVLEVPVKVGTSVIQANTFNDGTTIAKVADMTDLIFKGKIDETEVDLISEGMNVKIAVGAVNGSNYEAVIEKIAPMATEDNGTNTFEVKAALTSQELSKLRAGYSANATVILEKADSVLAVPERVVEYTGDSAFVYVLTSEQPKQQFNKMPITTGITDGINVEIKKQRNRYRQPPAWLSTELNTSTSNQPTMMTNLKQTAILAIAMLTTPHVDMRAETWTLENCVSYALTHNLSVKARQLNIESGQLQLTEAKDRFLPSLNASAGESLNFGRGLTANNTYADRNTTNFQWGASLQLPLFQGLSEYRQIKVAKSNLQQLLYEHEAAKDNVTLNIISQYLQVLYAKEVHASALSQLSQTTYEVGRQKALLEAGKVPEADLLDAESQKAQDELQVVTSENDIKSLAR